MSEVTLDQLREYWELGREFPNVAKLWTVSPKVGAPVSFRLNAAQKRLHMAIQELELAGKPVRVRVLKYRQAGVSVFCTARMLHWAMWNPGFVALSLADKAELPAQWIRRGKVWYEQTPFAPHVAASNAYEFWFDKIQSRYFVGSAEGQTPGMGETIRAIHCSEIASWRNPDAILSDLLPAVPPGRGTYVIQESTGRSRGDWWYQRYYAAKTKDDDYTAIFLPWFIQEEYRADPSEMIALNEREKALEKLGCDKAQLAWRRWQIRNEFAGDEAAFANQYPSTEDEAFLAGGRSVFNAEHVQAALKTVKPPVWRGDLIVSGRPTTYELVGTEGGRLSIWERPERGKHYAIGADVQFGSRGGGGTDKQDFDAAYVECIETGQLCARIKCRADMRAWATTIAALGYHYNDAALAPERNGRGAEGVIAVLLGSAGNGWSYRNLWVRDKLKAWGVRTPADYGWYTDQHTWPELTSMAMSKLLSHGGMDWSCGDACSELAALIWDDQDRINAPEGQHDDCVKARLIAMRVAQAERPALMARTPSASYEGLNDFQRDLMATLERLDAEQN